MKRYPLFLVLFLMGSVMLFSCKSKSNITVPKDAVAVFQINSASLSSKLSWKEIKEGEFFKETYKEVTDTLARKLMDDPDNSGVDTKADLIFFLQKKGKNGLAVFQGSLKDEAAFEAFIKKATSKTDIAASGDFKTVTMGNDAIITWNKTRFAFLGNAPIFQALSSMTGGNYNNDTSGGLTTDSLKTFGKAIFEISGSASIGSDDRFADLMKEPGDIHYWFNSGEYLGNIGGSMLSMLKVNDLFQGNISTGTFSFDNGKITVKTKQYVNDQLAALYKKYPPKNISADVINRIPSNNVVGVFAMNYPPEGLKDLLKLTGVDGLANGFLEKANFSIDEFVKANKGDLVVAITDLEVKTKEMEIPNSDGGAPYKYTSRQPDVKVLFATSINDKAAFQKLITTLGRTAGDDTAALRDVKYQLDNNWFVAGNSDDYITKFLKGGNSNQPFASKLAGHSTGLYIDLQKIFDASMVNSSDSNATEAMLISKKMWQDVLTTSGEFSGNSSSGLLEINLVDKNTNSLKQLNKYANDLGLLAKKRRSNNGMSDVQGPVVDTVVTAPPAEKN